jgi:hypothetical protein
MIYTRSQFYYGIDVNENNNKLDFAESSTDLEATMAIGLFSLTDFVQQLAVALSAETLGLTYTTSLDRTSRLVTITASGNFDIITDGANAGLSCWTQLGFTSNKTGASTYTSDTPIGSVYRPQFHFQEYTPFENYIESVEGSIKQSTSGRVEVVSFGSSRKMECKIMFITDNNQGYGAPIESNANGVSEALAFLNYAIKKGDIEFMADRDTPATYNRCILQSTPTSKDGIGFKLKEMKDLNGYYEMGLMVFREV